MKKTIIALLCVATFFSCKKDSPKEEQQTNDDDKYHDSGILVVSNVDAAAGNREGYYVGYYPALTDAASVDLTTKSSYTNFWINGQSGRYLYGISTSDKRKYSKLGVNKETGVVEEVANFPLLTDTYFSLVCNEEIGIVSQNNNLDLIVFDPKTMLTKGTIDMSKATKLEKTIPHHTYFSGAYRASDNRLFMYYFVDDKTTASYYDETSVYVEVINLATQKWEKTIKYEGAMYPISRGKENAVIDEDGNIYITCQGSYGLDGKLGPLATTTSRPQILKISAATNDFDKDYAFNPVDKLGYNNLMIQTLTGTIYDNNGIAYACVNASEEPLPLLQLIQKYATTGQLTEEEQAQLFGLAFYSVSQRWVKLDLKNKTASIINDIPLTASFAFPTSYKKGGKFYFNFNDGTKSGFYEYDPASQQSKQVINITKGGQASELVFLK